MDFTCEMTEKGSLFEVICMHNQDVVGHCRCAIGLTQNTADLGEGGYISKFLVDDGAREQHVGSRMFGELETWARKSRLTHLYTQVTPNDRSNVPISTRFLETRGFSFDSTGFAIKDLD